MAENRGHLLPLYLVVDESASMEPYIEDVNRALVSLNDALLADPMVASKVRLSALGFSDDVIRYLRLVDMRAELVFPLFTARATTNYGKLFAYLEAILSEDIGLLRSEGYMIHRPAVFFLTDGLPSDGEAWREPYAHLMSQKFHPNIVAFGIGNALSDTIRAIASPLEFGFVSGDVLGVPAAIASFFTSFTASVVASGRSITTAEPGLVIEKPEGFVLAIDVI